LAFTINSKLISKEQQNGFQKKGHFIQGLLPENSPMKILVLISAFLTLFNCVQASDQHKEDFDDMFHLDEHFAELASEKKFSYFLLNKFESLVFKHQNAAKKLLLVQRMRQDKQGNEHGLKNIERLLTKDLFHETLEFLKSHDSQDCLYLMERLETQLEQSQVKLRSLPRKLDFRLIASIQAFVVKARYYLAFLSYMYYWSTKYNANDMVRMRQQWKPFLMEPPKKQQPQIQRPALEKFNPFI
jgi:hypothetical protein